LALVMVLLPSSNPLAFLEAEEALASIVLASSDCRSFLTAPSIAPYWAQLFRIIARHQPFDGDLRAEWLYQVVRHERFDTSCSEIVSVHSKALSHSSQRY